jgi:malonate decarboxylase epsilon subunit
MSVAFLFPGQGSQRPAMLHALPDHAAVASTLDEASVVLGLDVRRLDSETALNSTVAVQLALLIAGVAAARTLQAEGAVPDLVAGHSVGAFAAAVTAGALEFRTALPLVRLRGELMEQAYPQGYGMGVIVGLDIRRVADLVAQVNSPAKPVFLANLNAPRQQTIAGSDAGINAVLSLAYASGARKAERLHVSVPSHCPLLAPVAEQLSYALAQVPLHRPRVPYIGNRRARALRDAEGIREDLATSVTHPVRWHDATTMLYERGARLFIELPPGHVLTNLASAAFPDARALAVDDNRLDSIAILVQREQSQLTNRSLGLVFEYMTEKKDSVNI